MKWAQRDESHWERECLQYTISRALMFDRDPLGAWRYSAWKRSAAEAGFRRSTIAGEFARTSNHTPTQIGPCVDDFNGAVALCAADIRKHKQLEAA